MEDLTNWISSQNDLLGLLAFFASVYFVSHIVVAWLFLRKLSPLQKFLRSIFISLVSFAIVGIPTCAVSRIELQARLQPVAEGSLVLDSPDFYYLIAFIVLVVFACLIACLAAWDDHAAKRYKAEVKIKKLDVRKARDSIYSAIDEVDVALVRKIDELVTSEMDDEREALLAEYWDGPTFGRGLVMRLGEILDSLPISDAERRQIERFIMTKDLDNLTLDLLDKLFELLRNQADTSEILDEISQWLKG